MPVRRKPQTHGKRDTITQPIRLRHDSVAASPDLHGGTERSRSQMKRSRQASPLPFPAATPPLHPVVNLAPPPPPPLGRERDRLGCSREVGSHRVDAARWLPPGRPTGMPPTAPELCRYLAPARVPPHPPISQISLPPQPPRPKHHSRRCWRARLCVHRLASMRDIAWALGTRRS
jgi:hypothetical protein